MQSRFYYFLYLFGIERHGCSIQYLIAKEWGIKMKKIVAFIMFLCLFVGLLAGCGSEKKSSTGSNEIKELKIAVSPYQDAETVKTAVGPLSTMLQGKLKEKGFAVGKVSVSVGTSYSAVGEALSAGRFPARPMCCSTRKSMYCSRRCGRGSVRIQQT